MTQTTNTLGPIGYTHCKKNADGYYQMFYLGTRNEVFPGMKFVNPQHARMTFSVEEVKRMTANK